MTNKRSPRSRQASEPARLPKTTATGPSDKDTPIFCFRFADRRTTNDWKFAPTPNDAQTILAQLAEVGCMEWQDILHLRDGNGRAAHHYQAVTDIERDAQKDLKRTKLTERFGDEMFRFAMGSARRLWGFRVERTFHVVFWDAAHGIYPTEKGNDKNRLKGRRRRDTAKKKRAGKK